MSARIDWLLKNLEESDTLTEWESEEFLPSVVEQYERNGTLSQPQIDKLEEIYREDNTRR